MAATDPNDSVYKTKTLSKWFAIASIILMIVTIWGILRDYDREWKVYGRQFKRISATIGEKRLAEANAAMDQSKLGALNKRIAELEKQQAAVTSDFDKEIESLQAVYYRNNQLFQFAKGKLDANLYILDEATKEEKPNVAELKRAWEKQAREVARLKDAADVAEKKRDDATAEKNKYLGENKKISTELTQLNKDRELQLKIIANNELGLKNLLRNAPLVDFISPTVKIQQVVLPNLLDDYSFNKVPRVDRCMTCHATIDKAGFESFPQPFKTHPNLALYMSADSKHPIEKFGCTVCHAGVPQSVDFALSGHTPRDLAQEHEWVQKYGYEHPDHLPTPMVPTAMTEGKCIQCHAKQIDLEGAPTFNAGMKLIQRYGCYGCHKFAGHFEELAKEKKPGPSLKMIASKVSEEWIRKWLSNPKNFRPTTLMPRYWGVHNNSDADSVERNWVEIDAIAHWLVAKSQKYEPLQLASNAGGNAQHGKELVGSIGCLGCHAVGDFVRKDVTDPKLPGFKDPRVPMFGPELNQMGSKVSKEWLYSWLINPKHYWENTSMPSLKLTSGEALDISEYLLSKRNEAFENEKFPEASDKVRDNVILTYYKASMTEGDAKTKLATLKLEDKKMYLGEKLITHYGCYGCHAISGFENMPNLGAELTFEGSKDISKFSFDATEMEHSRPNWIYTKIRTPRIWDVGKNRDFEGKARMPHFGFSKDQAGALTAMVLGYENKNVNDEAIYQNNARREQIAFGQRIVRRYNCQGCHAINNSGGEILGYYQDDITNGPPLLNLEGQKVQAQWLFNFLRNPSVTIRPWLKVRMPQFNLTQQETLGLTQYFAALDGGIYPFVSKHFDLLSAQDQKTAEALFAKQACLTCHGVRKPGEDLATSAPHFANVKARLNGDYVLKWIHNPQAIMPGTRMPTLWPQVNDDDPKAGNIAVPGYFGDDAEKQMVSIRNFLYTYGGPAEVPPPRIEDPYNNNNVTGLNPGPAALKAGSPAATPPAAAR